MAVQFYLSDPYPLINCPVCAQPLEEDVVEHEEGEDDLVHPIHQECLHRWVLIQPTCPMCEVEIDPEPFLTVSERARKIYDDLKSILARLAPLDIQPVSTSYLGLFAAQIAFQLAHEPLEFCPIQFTKTTGVIALTAGSIAYHRTNQRSSTLAILASFITALVLASLHSCQ